jgi:hypothetical protein
MSSSLSGAPSFGASSRKKGINSSTDWDSQMQSLLDAPVPKSVKDNNKKKNASKKKGGVGASSSAGDLLGLEDSADVNAGGADISLEESMGSKSSLGKVRTLSKHCDGTLKYLLTPAPLP